MTKVVGRESRAPREASMDEKRVVLDCRGHKGSDCSLAISGTEREVLELGELHATSKHGMKKEAGLRDELKGMLKEEALAR